MTAQDIEPTGPPLAASLGRQLNHAAKAARQCLERRLAAAGGGYVVWTVLASLAASGPLIQRELADQMAVEGPTLTHHLARMEAEGLVTRSRSTRDRRAARVALTEKGEALHRRLADVVHDEAGRVLTGISAEEAALMHGLLTRIIENCA